MSQPTILVVGGAGFVGSHINKMLVREGYPTIIFDSLIRGTRDALSGGLFVHGDLADQKALESLFSKHQIGAVMHFAAFADVGESFHKPFDYYQNNVANTLNLLQAMLHHNVKKLIFSSSAAIFGLPQQETITESHPCHPISPYGESKLMIEKVLKDLDKVHGLKYCCLRYFNAAGGDPHGEVKQRKAREYNLIPVVLRSLMNEDASVTINGTDYSTPDGTCVRDYVHVHDIGQAHIAALKKLLNDEPSCQYNLGNGQGFSIKQVVDTIEKVTGKRVKTTLGPRRQGDAPLLVANAKKAELELQWKPVYPTLDVMIEHAWNGMRN
jgi:UDP-glucose 4-epimerase